MILNFQGVSLQKSGVLCGAFSPPPPPPPSPVRYSLWINLPGGVETPLNTVVHNLKCDSTSPSVAYGFYYDFYTHDYVQLTQTQLEKVTDPNEQLSVITEGWLFIEFDYLGPFTQLRYTRLSDMYYSECRLYRGTSIAPQQLLGTGTALADESVMLISVS